MLFDTKKWAVLAICMISSAACMGEQPEAQGKVSFKADVKPVLERNCVVCHRPGAEGYKASGLSLESYSSLMKGANRGPVIKPGSSDDSVLVRAVSRDAKPPIVMPHRNPPLPRADIDIIKAWVNQGALDN